jgi:hypothetical protein
MLNVELDWLVSADAQAAFEFGHALGSLDEGAANLSTILNASVGHEPGLARGFVSGLIYEARIEPTPINTLLDQIEESNPVFSFQVALAGGDALHAFERALRLTAEGKLPAFHLGNFSHWVGNRRVTNDEVLEALETLLPFAAKGDSSSCDIIMHLLGARQHAGELAQLLQANSKLVWDAVIVTTDCLTREAYWWSRVLAAIAPTAPSAAVRLACRTMVFGNYSISREAETLVSQFASSYPHQVMEEVGKVMLSEEAGLRFFTGKFRIFTSIPPDIVIDWIRQHGVDAAQKIARHLPAPYLDGSGNPKLHQVTEYVLGMFEDDDRTFAEFCAGVHSFQVYVGDIADAREREAKMAEKFVNHRLRRVREWAMRERESAIRDAQWHREHEDEIGL